MSNRLIHEKSPYLLQHADNPVDWHPWGDEAFRLAREKDLPVFLSVGYATCHWCHVMAHESFEDDEVAGLLNGNFISIKVDREERPDVDQIYMTVCQVLNGSGGWPLSVFMTPDRKPFFAGTYFPKTSRMGSPGFIEVLQQLSIMWRRDRSRLVKASDEITNAIQPRAESSGKSLGVETLEKAYEQFRRSFDSRWGGFGKAPKFPTPHQLSFLLRWHRRNPESEALEMVEKTLEAMRRGGIFDHVGFGFHRYSVDQRWLVPHFEKMLYDQAMLAIAYIEAFQVTGKERYAAVAREIFHYVLRDMTSPEGGFYSAEDADSEGEEGLFYVWTPKEVKEVLGNDAGDLFCRFYDISEAGNFEGRNIPHTSRSMEDYAAQLGMPLPELEKTLEDSRQKLFAHREKRIHPLKDDKILTSWNGLMIAAMARGFQAMGDRACIDAAVKAADFILAGLRSDSGRLLRRYRHGDVAVTAYADDYAFLVWGLMELYQSVFDVRYLEEAVRLNREMLEIFWDEGNGGFYYTGSDSEPLIVREKDIFDGAVPAANAVAALNLLRLARMTGNTGLEATADRQLQAFSSLVGDYPSAHTQFLIAVDFAVGPSQEVVIAGAADHEDTRRMMAALRKGFSPNCVVLLRRDAGAKTVAAGTATAGTVADGTATAGTATAGLSINGTVAAGTAGNDTERLSALSPFVKDLVPADDGKTTAYVCENFACKRPVTNVEELESNLELTVS